MQRFAFRLSFAAAFLFALSACASAGPVAPAPPAVDLGSSSRVPRVAGHAGEGEGYDRTVIAAVPAPKPSVPAMDHASMPGMSGPDAGPQTAQAGRARAQGTGTINSVDAAGHKVNLSHQAIPAIGWPPMTMDFAVAPSVDLGSIKPGMRVDFTMEQGSGGMYVIQSLTPAGGGKR